MSIRLSAVAQPEHPKERCEQSHIKSTEPELRPALQALLSRYSMLARFRSSEPRAAAVVAVLTGDEGQKRAWSEWGTELCACVDRDQFDLADPPADQIWPLVLAETR